MLMRRAVLPLRKRRALAWLALAGGRTAAGDAAVERARLDLLLDEPARGADALGHRPGDLRLVGDREVPAEILEQRPVRLGEVVRIGGEALHRALTGLEHRAPVFDLRPRVGIRVDQVLDRAIDRSRVLIHALPELEGALFHVVVSRLFR